MPQLDYKNAVGAGTRVLPTAKAFYKPVGEHPTVKCPDCGKRADAEFGDHGGDCAPRRTGRQAA